MARAALLALLITFAPALPEGCAKLVGKGQTAGPKASAEPQPQPVAVTSAATTTATPSATVTAPPVWAPPDTGGPPPTPAPVASVNPDLAKARTLSEAGDHKKVRALLEKKVKTGKANHEEATILMESCLILRDKSCVEAIKAKHPDVEGP
jgi:hypothetical protein